MKTVRLLFSDDMARAIVEGRKTVTRRPVMPQPAEWPSTGEGLWRGGRRFPHEGGPDPLAPCVPGNLLIGRECFQAWTGGEMSGYEEADGVLDFDYAAYSFTYRADGDCTPKRWRPSIHMPDAAARIRRRVVSVTVERLRDITDEDARREGILDGGCETCGESSYPNPCGCSNPRPVHSDAFAWVWDAIYEANGLGWAVNPWVWRIEFAGENERGPTP